jgi:uncharacterized protein YkwD
VQKLQRDGLRVSAPLVKFLILGILGGFFMLGTGPIDVDCEPLVVLKPVTPVVRLRDESQLIVDVNRYRETQGLPLVAVDRLLARAALLHARDMAQRKFFGHTSPDGKSLPDRLDSVGFRWTVAAENIAFDEDAPHANAALLQSAPHRANILDPRVQKIGVAALGVGVNAVLYVEVFAV